MPRNPLPAICLLTALLAALAGARPADAQPYISGGKHAEAVWNNVDLSSGSGHLEVTVPFKGKRNSLVIVSSTADADNYNGTCDIQTSLTLNATTPGE